MRSVTVNTDASFSKITGHGSYAFWIVCDGFRIKRSGVFKEKPRNPHEAEARAILNAMHVLLKFLPGIEVVYLNTDSLNCIHVFNKDKKNIQRYRLRYLFPYRDKLEKIKKENNQAGVRIDFRHVKSHTGIDDKRSYVNEWCDTNAKARLKEFLLKEGLWIDFKKQNNNEQTTDSGNNK